MSPHGRPKGESPEARVPLIAALNVNHRALRSTELAQ